MKSNGRSFQVVEDNNDGGMVSNALKSEQSPEEPGENCAEVTMQDDVKLQEETSTNMCVRQKEMQHKMWTHKCKYKEIRMNTTNVWKTLV
jgi:hypothetical protein